MPIQHPPKPPKLARDVQAAPAQPQVAKCSQCHKTLDGPCLADFGKLYCGRVCANARSAATTGHTYTCPQCQGTGWEYNRDVADVEMHDPADGHNGWFSPLAHRAVMRHESKRCDFCEGRGFLDKKPVPIVEPERITGWRKG